MKNLVASMRTLSHALVAVLAVIGTIVVVGAVTPTRIHTRTVTGSSPAAVASARAVAVQTANETPSLGCDPATGSGKLGACAPHAAIAQASNLVRAVTRSASGYTSSFVGTRPIGVDVSSYQGCGIDWARVPVRFAFFKATEGVYYTDRCLKANVASAKRARLPYGVYDFLRPGRSTPQAEADHFASAARAAGANTSLPPVADVEVNAGLTPAQVGRYVCAWHQRVRALLHRSVTITYTGAWFWNPQVAGSSCGSLLWVSAYTFAPIIPRAWARHTIWQYSDGIYGPVPHVNRWDSNAFNGSLGELRLLAGIHPKPRPRPKPKPKPRPPAKHVSAADRELCRRLNAWRHNRRPHRWLHAAQRQRRTLVLHGVTCLPGKPARR